MASKERSTSPTDDPVPRNEFGGVYGENILCELFGKWLSRDAVTVLKERGHHTQEEEEKVVVVRRKEKSDGG